MTTNDALLVSAIRSKQKNKKVLISAEMQLAHDRITSLNQAKKLNGFS